ncbi:hypothetical protein SKAU_G00226370 [Synaphobranchus kaupii]|uniref:Uncharacterized protein n=1 Tax=Synaphobranchus kaupii TaxID=118154 RepID=A0A9Q1ISW6_SYNKA|nr:hypothetical protein SKAU_G00226370 [Synaphobranchus kaupii]
MIAYRGSEKLGREALNPPGLPAHAGRRRPPPQRTPGAKLILPESPRDKLNAVRCRETRCGGSEVTASRRSPSRALSCSPLEDPVRKQSQQTVRQAWEWIATRGGVLRLGRRGIRRL